MPGQGAGGESDVHCHPRCRSFAVERHEQRLNVAFNKDQSQSRAIRYASDVKRWEVANLNAIEARDWPGPASLATKKISSGEKKSPTIDFDVGPKDQHHV